MELISFIPESLFIVVVATYVLGIFLKQLSIVSNTTIPMILLPSAILFSVLVEGASAQSFIQGILCYGVSSGIHNFGHELKKKKNGRE